MFDFGCTEWVHVKSDPFAFPAVAIAFESADLIESNTEIGTAEGFVLVEFQTILIIEMERPKLAEGHGKINFIRGVEASKDCLRGLNETSNALGSASQLGNSQGMANRGQISMIHRLIWFGFNCEPNFPIVSEHFVQCLNKQIHAPSAVLGLAQISSLAGDPQHDQVCSNIIGDVNGAQRALDSILATFWIVAGVCAINGHRTEPKARGHYFSEDACVVQFTF